MSLGKYESQVIREASIRDVVRYIALRNIEHAEEERERRRVARLPRS